MQKQISLLDPSNRPKHKCHTITFKNHTHQYRPSSPPLFVTAEAEGEHACFCRLGEPAATTAMAPAALFDIAVGPVPVRSAIVLWCRSV